MKQVYDIDNFGDFLYSWKGKKYSKNYFFISSEFEKYGRICSDIKTPTGPILSKNDNNFWKVIEVGVSKLIKIIAFDLNLITFCSCEGHIHLSNNDYVDSRFIKILFYSYQERDFYLKLFTKIGKNLNNDYIYLKVESIDPYFIVKKLRKKMPSIQISFESINGNYNDYFKNIDIIYNNFCFYLSKYIEKIGKK